MRKKIYIQYFGSQTYQAHQNILIIFMVFILVLLSNFNKVHANENNSANLISRQQSFFNNKNNMQYLTFEDRINCQKAIEKVYWAQRVWPKDNPNPKPSFKSMINEEAMKSKVDNILRKSNALDYYWHKPITGKQLQAELERMAKGTKKPEILKQIFASLDNNPYLIAECLARPILADRLIRNWYNYDEKFHGKLKKQAEAELKKYSDPAQMKLINGKYREKELKKSENQVAFEEITHLPIGKIGMMCRVSLLQSPTTCMPPIVSIHPSPIYASITIKTYGLQMMPAFFNYNADINDRVTPQSALINGAEFWR